MASSIPGSRRVDCRAGSIPARTTTSQYLEAASPGGRIARLITDYPFLHRLRKRGDYLFRAGDPFNYFYVLNAGFVKTSYLSTDGREQTTGFHLRGDILGLDAVATGVYGCDAIALDVCDVLAIPYDVVLTCSQRNPELVHELYRAFSSEIRNDRDLMLSTRSLPATGRVAAFLLEMSIRFAARGFSPTELQLRLTREEIGDMLGLKLETVSRAFSHFAHLGLISVFLREIVLLDRKGLLDMVVQPLTPKRNRVKAANAIHFPRTESAFPGASAERHNLI
jgi:CRP/FNR family transcriptional regulator